MNDERDELWDILGKAKKPVVSPFFAANVLREVRQTAPSHGFIEWLRRQWRIAGVASTALLVVAVTLGYANVERHAAEKDRLLLVQQVAGNPDYDVINHLDELVASQEDSLWLEPTLD